MFGSASQMLSRMGRSPLMNNRLPGKIQQAQPMPQQISQLPPNFWAQFSRQAQVAPPMIQSTPAQLLSQFGRNQRRLPVWRGR